MSFPIPKQPSTSGYDAYSKYYGAKGPKPTLERPVSKSWLFEIVDSESGAIEKSFTLLMPPTGISIKEPQRVSITKTFGNAFVDDYGPDNIQITLKGFSGTSHVFPTFRTRGSALDFSDVSKASEDAASRNPTTGYTGRDAFYIFRRDIIRYKDRDGWDKKELRVYDLADEQSYKCILLDFTLDLSMDTPVNRYPYSISLFVYDRPEKSKPKLKAIHIGKNPTMAMNDIEKTLSRLEEAYKDVKNIVNQVYLLQAKVRELRSKYNSYLNQAKKILTMPLDVAKGLIDTAFIALQIVADTYKAGLYVLDRYMNAAEMFESVISNGIRIYGYQISQGWQASRELVIEMDDGINTDNDVVSRNVIGSSYTFSGLTIYTIKGDDTLQRIALETLGDSTLWPYIASVNPGINSNDDLVPGETLFIPVQVETTSGDNKELFILTEDVTRDPYGTDIKLDSEGNIIIQENSDFALVSGSDNVIQSVDLRLNTDIGSILTQTAFGLSVQAGMAGSSMAIRYLKMSIRATLSADPRIESIDNLMVNINGDTINMGMDIKLVGSEQSIPVSTYL